ncbi:MAG TPA: ATP-binding protein [bacterium]|nr:ATP-binding protein [bacterium]
MAFMSLKTRTALWAALLTLSTTGLLGSYLVWSSYEALRGQVQQSQRALARTLAWEVDQGLSTALQTISVFAKDPRTLARDKAYIIREMTLITSTTEYVDALLWYDRDGSLWAKSISGVSSAEYPPDRFVRQTLERSGQLEHSVLVEVYTAASGHLEIGISAPVFRQGELQGVLVGVMHLPNHVIGNMDTARIGRSGYAYLVNHEGIAILHPDRAKWLRDLSGNPAVKAFQTQKEGSIQFRNQDGEEVVAAFSPVKTSDWGVIVRQPASECYESATRMLWGTTFFVILAMAASAFLSIVLAERFVDPILNLAREAEGFRTLETFRGSAMKAAANDEIGLLKQALFRMMGTIRSQDREKERAYLRTLKAERKAAESERLATVGQWSAGLAHELNNPLTVILGGVRMALRSGKRKKDWWIREIGKEAERCRRLLGDLLDIAKPRRITPRDCDLAGMVRETWDRLPERGVPFELRLQPDRFRVRVDPDRFAQVLLNLLKNSREAMAQGGIVQVELRREGGFNRLVLTDQGPGIPPRQLRNLFKPFFTTKAQGTGLGLAMVQAILREHRGTVLARNRKPRGLRMVLEWPVDLSSKGKK